MMSRFPESLLVVTNAEPLQEVVIAIARQKTHPSTRIFGLTYSNYIPHLPALVEETDCFVLELFCQYSGGMRAEGIIFAQRIARQGKGSLVISPLSLAAHLSCRMYWDVSSSDTLSERVAQLPMAIRPDVTELERLAKAFAPLLPLPPQHER